MIDESTTPQEAVRLAIERERGAKDFYTQAAKIASTRERNKCSNSWPRKKSNILGFCRPNWTRTTCRRCEPPPPAPLLGPPASGRNPGFPPSGRPTGLKLPGGHE